MMLEDVLAIPEHIGDALWRVGTARVASGESAGVLLCGMGGSAIGGDLAVAALGNRLTRPFLTVRGYELPSWTTADWTVLCVSYSGNTEETLSCFDAAEARGARRIAVSTGGALADKARSADVPVIGLPGLVQAPRCAVAYMFVVAVAAAAFSGAAPDIRDEIEAAAAALEEDMDALQARAAEIASGLAGSLPVAIGAGLTAPVARRWATQMNENAKLPAFFSELPEADHNEVCGWAGAPSDVSLAAVLLEDAAQGARARRRFELTAEAIESGGSNVVRVEVSGESRSERLLRAVVLGDLASLANAEARGVDPLPVEAIESLKAALERS
jgi:glucose/mannose-6-phosphate isomerase